MSDAKNDANVEEGNGGESLDEGVKYLIKNALGPSEPPVDVLGGVQRKLRQRSRGKFYADRWSTARQPPIVTYLITSLVMLAIVFVIYAVLAPLRGKPVEVENRPEPVQVLPPQ
jgi:hypothetical protein